MTPIKLSTRSKPSRPYRLLLVEDNLADARLIRWAIGEANAPVQLEMVTNGQEALEFLSKARQESALTPDVMLVDLNLPKIDGLELLKQVKASEDFYDIPIVIFSTSHRADDRERCLKSRATAFYTKPSDLDAFEAMVRRLVEDEFPKAIFHDVA